MREKRKKQESETVIFDVRVFARLGVKFHSQYLNFVPQQTIAFFLLPHYEIKSK